DDQGTLCRGERIETLDIAHRIREPHVEAVVASQHHSIGADEAYQVGVDFVVVPDRVVREPPQVRARQLFHVLQLGTYLGAMIEATDEPRERAAGVRKIELQLWKRIEHSAEQQ